jgi:hypothetical protein
MKKNLFFSMIISLLIVSCTQQESKFPQGAWNLVQTQTITDGKVEIGFPVAWTGSLVKMWSEKNWSNIGKWVEDTLSGDIYAGGTYTLEGNQYEEYIVCHSAKQYEGRKSTNMVLELKNDILILSYHPFDSTGKQIENISSLEKYIRLK